MCAMLVGQQAWRHVLVGEGLGKDVGGHAFGKLVDGCRIFGFKTFVHQGSGETVGTTHVSHRGVLPGFHGSYHGLGDFMENDVSAFGSQAAAP